MVKPMQMIHKVLKTEEAEENGHDLTSRGTTHFLIEFLLLALGRVVKIALSICIRSSGCLNCSSNRAEGNVTHT